MRVWIAILVLGLVGLTGCASKGVKPAPISTQAVYRLGSGDMLRITIYGEEKLTGEYRVGDDGTVALPLIGAVPASGKTTAELNERIAARFTSAGLLQKPNVASEVIAYRPFFILGEVQKPGQYPFIPGMTVRQAIATANGYTYRARQSQIMVTHWGEKNEVAYELDAGMPLAPGDTIRVPERHF
jgi:protein involved in polysaccharide export with SLBB domain